MVYPITKQTKLSITKTARLLQTLVDLAHEHEEEAPGNDNDQELSLLLLPKNIQQCITEVLGAQNKLVKTIDNYMHSDNRKVDEIKVVTSIIETCPEFLATTNNDKFKALPIHWFAHSSDEDEAEDATSKYVPLLAEVGRKHQIGGEGARGGLLVEDAKGLNALHHLTANKSSEVMESLKNADPPLLFKEDVRKYNLLHEAIRNESIEMVKFMKELDPSCLYYKYDKHDKYGLPVEQQSSIYQDYPEIDEETRKNRVNIEKYLLDSETVGAMLLKIEKF